MRMNIHETCRVEMKSSQADENKIPYVIEAHSRNWVPSGCRRSHHDSSSAPLQMREGSEGCLNGTPEIDILKNEVAEISTCMCMYIPI